MTPKERAFFIKAGIVLLDNFASLFTSTLLHGIFVLLFTISTTIIIISPPLSPSSHSRRGLTVNTKARLASLLITTLTFLLASIWWASFIATLAIEIRTWFVGIHRGRFTAAQVAAVTRRLYALAQVQSVVTYILPIINDGVVIWRAWALFAERRWVMILPLALLLGTTATSSAYIALYTYPATFKAAMEGRVTTQMAIARFSIACMSLSFLTNVVTTSLVAAKLLQVLSLPSIPPRNRYLTPDAHKIKQLAPQRVMLLLVESGAFYCVLQMSFGIMEVLPASRGSALRIAGRTVFAAFFEISAMLPAFVVVLVHRQRSFVETYGYGNGAAVDFDPGERALASVREG
ncbi:hypothetical protein D9615_004773 [Tricholomella constricta]|uniref:Uncharacterized protein n=1 Tax=Tricholomella constricta TaxID=117010 RepID=A0A8H5M7A4_9AGAR|nr:hypothetical protein D9615_004773 [Tricholomella constricta]